MGTYKAKHLKEKEVYIINDNHLNLMKKGVTLGIGAMSLSTAVMPSVATVQAATPAQQQAPQVTSGKLSQAQVVARVGQAAQATAPKYGLYASIMAAQALLESGYGQSTLASQHNNYFGIKAKAGEPSVAMSTAEYLNGKWVYPKENFRTYTSVEEGFVANAKLLSGWSFYSGAWVKNCNTYEDAAKWLQGRYATDPTYASKLISVIKAWNLTQYDTAASSESVTWVDSSNTAVTTTYTIKSGDSLWAIATKHGMSVADLCRLNGISQDTMIHPGQQLKVSENAPAASATPSAPSAPASKPVVSASVYYTVASGDSLWAISNAHGMSLTDLCQLNGLSVNSMIHPGQQLLVKQGGTTSVPVTSTPVISAPSTPVAPSNAATYTVVSGDGLWSIATKHGISMTDLMAWNGLDMNSMLHPGQVLKVSDGAAPVASTPADSSGAASGVHTVQKGENLTTIAAQHGTTAQRLATANNMQLTDIIYIGQQLRIV
jgi:flagellum-specific peptidoglycan hydrolase FlgJ/murein DD-endopeptidase MepM/ murein hydrolase activator NlpD